MNVGYQYQAPPALNLGGLQMQQRQLQQRQKEHRDAQWEKGIEAVAEAHKKMKEEKKLKEQLKDLQDAGYIQKEVNVGPEGLKSKWEHPDYATDDKSDKEKRTIDLQKVTSGEMSPDDYFRLHPDDKNDTNLEQYLDEAYKSHHPDYSSGGTSPWDDVGFIDKLKAAFTPGATDIEKRLGGLRPGGLLEAPTGMPQGQPTTQTPQQGPQPTVKKSPYPEYPDAFLEGGIWKVRRNGKKYKIED